MEKKNKKAVIWLRVSTKKQDLTQQKEDLTKFAKSEGFSEKDLIFIEGLGASAIKQDQLYEEIMEELYKTLQNEPVGVIYCWEISRLARDKGRFEDLKKFLVKEKIQLVIYKPETVRLLNADGNLSRLTDLIFMFSSWVAEAEMSIKAERFSRGRAYNKERGRFNGGPNGVLYGYLVNDAGYIKPCKSEAKIVEQIFREYASGKYSVRSLAKELKNRGVMLRDRKISDNNLNNMLRNSSYIGKNKDGVKYDAIIDQELWDKVEAIRTGNDLGIRKSKESRNISLGAKILKCKECGGNYTASSGKYVCYRHSKPDRFEDDPCNNSLSISVEVMDLILWDAAKEEEIASRKRYSQASIPELREQIKILTDKLEQIDVRVADIEDRKLRSTRSYNKGRISEEEEDRNQGELMLERFQVEAERERYLYERQDIEDHIDDIVSGKPVDTSDLLSYTQVQKRELVLKHISEAHIEKIYRNGKYHILVEIILKSGNKAENAYLYSYTVKKRDLQIKKILLKSFSFLTYIKR